MSMRNSDSIFYPDDNPVPAGSSATEREALADDLIELRDAIKACQDVGDVGAFTGGDDFVTLTKAAAELRAAPTSQKEGEK